MWSTRTKVEDAPKQVKKHYKVSITFVQDVLACDANEAKEEALEKFDNECPSVTEAETSVTLVA